MQCPDCGQRHAQGAPDCPAGRVGATVAGRYRLLRLIGAGGMGAVYEAQHLALGTRVALKTILARAARGADAAARFQREARAVADIRHPGIVDVKDLGQDDDGSPFMVLELLEGQDAWSLLSDGPLSIDRAVWIAIQALDALAVAHARGIIHRDLKPANLFVAQLPRSSTGGPGGERVKILDFGLAKVLEPERVALTRTGYFMGSAPYMSPEQTQDAKRVDERCDVYAMGVTLFELLTGYLPVSGDSSMQMLVRVGAGEINRSPRSLRPEVPEWLDAVVARALAFEPANRFASALDMKAALEEGAAAQEGDDGRPTREVGVASGPAPAVPETAPSIRLPASGEPRARRGRGLLVVAVLAVLVAGGAVLALLWPTLVAPGSAPQVVSPLPAVPPLAVQGPTSSRAPAGETLRPTVPFSAEPSVLAPVPPVSGAAEPPPPAKSAPPVRPVSSPPASADPPRAPSGAEEHEDDPPVPAGAGAGAVPHEPVEREGDDRSGGEPLAPPALPVSGGNDVPAHLSAPDFFATMDGARFEVHQCVGRGGLRVEVRLSGDGRVTGASVLQGASGAEAACVVRVLRGLRFPRFGAAYDVRGYLY